MTPYDHTAADAAREAREEARQDAMDCLRDEAADALEEECLTNGVYANLREMIASYEAMTHALPKCGPYPYHLSLGTAIRQAERWCDSYREETAAELADAAAEQSDPYGYRGLSRKDFL